VHNPHSNAKLGVGLMPLAAILLRDRIGVIAKGAFADLVVYDLKALDFAL